MLIKTHPAMAVLFNSRQTTLGELQQFTGTAIKELYKYVADLDLLVCGPSYWFYYGSDGRPETRFTLDIAIPVFGQVPTALLPYFKQLPAAKCLSTFHVGSWQTLPCAYNKMVQYISENGLQMSGNAWEAFLHIDWTTPENNVTEISIGLL